MITLVIGTGGREHALAAALARDPEVTEVHAAPGNPGIAQVATLHDVDPLDPAAVADLAERLNADLVVVGPEAPLVAGVADAVRDRGISCFGPSAEAAQLEGSKAFAKDVMAGAEVPTAMAHVCTTAEEAAAALDAFGAPYVVKDDGLAAGKGVVVTSDRDEALAHAVACDQVVIEEYLDGPEVSLFAITDGVTVYPLQPAQDFKRIFDNDEGPNTGGMGAYTPLPWAPEGLVDEVLERVLQPTVDEMARRGTPFSGLLYAGLALTKRGVRVIEFNARFGDPETQPLMALLDSPLGVLLKAAADGRLDEAAPPRWKQGAAVAVVMASRGYPESSSQGDVITGIDAAEATGAQVIHAGTALQDGSLVTAGGRVLAVVGLGSDIADARTAAYAGVAEISFDGAQYRSDIAAGQ
ncbi:MAG: phosphoribosylamine--glycine ligase [Marmoricola sp.]